MWKNEECGWQGECRETQRGASRSHDCMSMHVHWSHLASELKFGELMRSAIEPALFAMKFEDLSMRACGPFHRQAMTTMHCSCTFLLGAYRGDTRQIRCTRGDQREAAGKELRKCRHLETTLARPPGRHRSRTITFMNHKAWEVGGIYVARTACRHVQCQTCCEVVCELRISWQKQPLA